MRPNKNDCIPYFEKYINLVAENNLMDALKNNKKEISEFISKMPASKENYKYAEGKWTIKQVLNHLIDTERIFSYRALRFARGDNQLLRSYDENVYADNANLQNTNLNILAAEFNAVRDSSILFFQQLSEKELLLKGKLESGETNVLALGYTICGHNIHHVEVIKERYL